MVSNKILTDRRGLVDSKSCAENAVEICYKTANDDGKGTGGRRDERVAIDI